MGKNLCEFARGARGALLSSTTVPYINTLDTYTQNTNTTDTHITDTHHVDSHINATHTRCMGQDAGVHVTVDSDGNGFDPVSNRLSHVCDANAYTHPHTLTPPHAYTLTVTTTLRHTKALTHPPHALQSYPPLPQVISQTLSNTPTPYLLYACMCVSHTRCVHQLKN